jgi:hypothetical protein
MEVPDIKPMILRVGFWAISKSFVRFEFTGKFAAI